jgi:hypothetical protein
MTKVVTDSELGKQIRANWQQKKPFQLLEMV